MAALGNSGANPPNSIPCGLIDCRTQLFVLAPRQILETLSLHEDAAFLRMHPEEVRERAKRGVIPDEAGKALSFH